MKHLLHPGKWFLMATLLLALVALAACANTPSPTSTTPIPTTTLPTTTTPVASPTPTPSASPTPSPTGTPAGTPTIEIVSPGSGNKFGIGDETISVQVSNFKLLEKLGQPNVSGEGHIHYFMDVDPPTTPGQPAVTTPGTYAPSAATAYTWHNVYGGQHKFSVELVNNNHTPLNPPVTASVSLLVIPEIGPPGLVIVSPRDGAILPAGDITVTAQAANFNTVDKLGQANAQREGHFHYFLDVDAPTTPGKPAVTAPGTYAATASDTYTWPNVGPGMHTLSVELINNDHTPIDPPVVAKVMITVTGSSPTATPTSTPTSTPSTTPSPTGQAVTINIKAKNIAFDMSSITVPAGAEVTINFDNQDSGIPHNVAVYENLAGGQTRPVFVGKIINGPATITYVFTAPAAAGSYFFDCDVHPQVMKGSFIVTQ
jgi:plastocyanin